MLQNKTLRRLHARCDLSSHEFLPMLLWTRGISDEHVNVDLATDSATPAFRYELRSK